MAQALGPHGIYVTTVAPGFVETDMAAPFLEGAAGDAIRAQSPLNRAATAQEIAHVAVFLATPGADYTTGAIVDVNGLNSARFLGQIGVPLVSWSRRTGFFMPRGWVGGSRTRSG
jgi:3-oxoacyl-[acyl-carrier protein] reductase